MASSTRTRRPVDDPEDDVRGLRAMLHRPRPDNVGSRVAAALAAAFLAAVVGVLPVAALVNRAYAAGTICRGDDSLGCPLLWLFGSLAAALAVLLALGAWFFRLGWRWWLVTVSLGMLLVEVVVDPLSPWLVLSLLAPVAGALLADPDLPRRRWRTIGIVVLAVVAFGWLGWAVIAGLVA